MLRAEIDSSIAPQTKAPELVAPPQNAIVPRVRIKVYCRRLVTNRSRVNLKTLKGASASPQEQENGMVLADQSEQS